MLIESKLVKDVVSKVFPELKKRTVNIRPSTSITFSGNYWSGGYRNYYAVVKLDTMQIEYIPDDNPLRHINDNVYDIPEGVCVVIHTYSGIRNYGTIVVHPNNMPLNLTSNQPQLSNAEEIVLDVTCSYKNSYGGETNLRQKYAKQKGLTAEEFKAAQLSLKEKGLLDGRFAVTMNGKNARKNTY